VNPGGTVATIGSAVFPFGFYLFKKSLYKFRCCGVYHLKP